MAADAGKKSKKAKKKAAKGERPKFNSHEVKIPFYSNFKSRVNKNKRKLKRRRLIAPMRP